MYLHGVNRARGSGLAAQFLQRLVLTSQLFKRAAQPLAQSQGLLKCMWLVGSAV